MQALEIVIFIYHRENDAILEIADNHENIDTYLLINIITCITKDFQ